MATVIRMRLAHFTEENMEYRIRKITRRGSGMMSVRRFWERCADSYSPAHSRRSPGGSLTPLATDAMASSTVLPRSRPRTPRSEEHTSELQSLRHLVCRLLLGKK